MFAIEELSRAPEQRNSGLLVAGIVLAGLVAVSILGNGTYFGVIQVPALPGMVDPPVQVHLGKPPRRAQYGQPGAAQPVEEGIGVAASTGELADLLETLADA